MAKDERNIYTIQNDASKGEIKIADEVVAKIAVFKASVAFDVNAMPSALSALKSCANCSLT